MFKYFSKFKVLFVRSNKRCQLKTGNNIIIHLMKILTSILLYFCFLSINAQSQKNYALTNVNLFNGFESKIYPTSIVFVKAGKVEKIGKQGDAISKEYEVIDCMGYYLMPGMIDAHTHLD